MQDLIEDYVSNLNKLRDVFHNELTATAEELSKAMALYALHIEAALASFMEKVSARGVEFERDERRTHSWSPAPWRRVVVAKFRFPNAPAGPSEAKSVG